MTHKMGSVPYFLYKFIKVRHYNRHVIAGFDLSLCFYCNHLLAQSTISLMPSHQQQLLCPVMWAGLHPSKTYDLGFLLALESFYCYTMSKINSIHSHYVVVSKMHIHPIK